MRQMKTAREEDTASRALPATGPAAPGAQDAGRHPQRIPNARLLRRRPERKPMDHAAGRHGRGEENRSASAEAATQVPAIGGPGTSSPIRRLKQMRCESWRGRSGALRKGVQEML